LFDSAEERMRFSLTLMTSGISRSRRDFLKSATMAASAFLLTDAERAFAGDRSRLAVEVYIWVELLGRQHRSLSEGLPEIFSTARAAGFTNIELNDEFFGTALRERTLALLAQKQMTVPCVYLNGAMHEETAGAETVRRGLETFTAAKPAGCGAMVCDPWPKQNGEKTDTELATQVRLVNELGRKLAAEGCNLRFHNHKVELASNAREWRFMLEHTDPAAVSVCLDIDWVNQAGHKPMELLREAGHRVREIHVRSSHHLVWDEAVEEGADVDFRPIAAWLRTEGLKPLVVVELAYADGTVVTRPLVEDLRRSREFTERTFGVS